MKNIFIMLSIFIFACNFCFAQSSLNSTRQTSSSVDDIVSMENDTTLRVTPTSEVSFEKIYREIINLLDQGKYDEAKKYFFSYDEAEKKKDELLSEKEKAQKAVSMRKSFPDIVEVYEDGMDGDEGILYILGNFKSGDKFPIVYTFAKKNGHWLWSGIKLALKKDH